jgi:chitin disaccharide deacetylase
LKRLVINADDFGFTRDVNAGIVQAHREGVLTATTLMANGDAFEDAVRLARETPALDIGCHLVLVQGRSLITGQPFPGKIPRLLALLLRKQLDVYAELRAQIERITAAGIRPSHLDSHKHTHVLPNVFRQVVRLAQEFHIPYVRLSLGSPYRRFAARYGVQMTDHFLGFRLTGSLDEQTLASTLAALPDGTTELMCHPGYLGPELAAASTRLKESRINELDALTSPRIRQLVIERQIQLTSFADLANV